MEIDYDCEIVLIDDIFQSENFIEIFWSKVDIKGEDECWEWLGAKGHGGYGRFSYDNNVYAAHRLCYEFEYGKFPRGLFICHKCDNPLCVNPKHLYLGTEQDNTNDMMRRGRNGVKFIEKVFSDDKVLLMYKIFYDGKTKSDIIDEINVKLNNRKINKHQLEIIFKEKF